MKASVRSQQSVREQIEAALRKYNALRELWL